MSEFPRMKTNSAKAWLLASRPKTLTGAWVPVIIATALAYSDHTFKWQPAILCLLFASLMQIAANFINDLIDFKKGTDRSDRLGPERACAQGWITPKAMQAGIAATILTACTIGLLLLFWGSLWLIAVGVSCVIFAFLYTTVLSYFGLGDLLVYIFFGFVPVMGTYYVQAGSLTTDTLLCSLSSGLVIDLLLIINNYRDRDTDRRSGKRTLISMFGERFGNRQYLLTGILAWGCCIGLIPHHSVWALLLPALFLPLHLAVWKEMVSINQGKALNKVLGKTSRNMFVFALLVSIGLLL